MTRAVVIGLGNSFRRDDGVGPAVAAAVDVLQLPGVRVVCAADATTVLDAWDGVAVAVVVDAAAGGIPGRVRHCGPGDVDRGAPAGSHDLSLRQTYELSRVLGRAPAALVVVTVDIGDAGHGVGLSPAVTAALPEAVRVVERLVSEQAEKPSDQ